VVEQEKMLVRRFIVLIAPFLGATDLLAADADSIFGVHWWGNQYPNPPADGGASAMLNSVQQGAYDLEIANTHNEFFWSAEWLRPLYQDLYLNKHVTPITRIDYAFGETVPGPDNPDQTAWKNNVVGVMNVLRDYAHLWQLGNECNLNGEANHWGAAKQITPTGYAQIYQDVHAAMLAGAQISPGGAHKLLIAPPSPGGAAGDRWIDGNAWLGQTVDAFGANKSLIDGIALHAYGGGDAKQSLIGFRSSLVQQLALIDSKGLTNLPIYITEFNRLTNINDGNDEAQTAQFLRDAYKFLNQWNSVPGNHNIITATWFTYDNDTTGGGGVWDGYSVEYWKTHGLPAGNNGDLYTAFQQTAVLGYKAGISGTKPIPTGVTLIDDFETGNGHFTTDPAAGNLTRGVSSSFKVATPDDSWSHAQGQKVGITYDSVRAGGWYVRYVSGGGSPASNTPIALTPGQQSGWVGFFLRVFTNSGSANGLTCYLTLDSGAGGGALTDAGVERTIIADGDWHWYEWSLDKPSEWTIWRDADGNVVNGSDGVIATSGTVSIDSIIFKGGTQTVEYFLDTVTWNKSGSINVMAGLPEPQMVFAMLLTFGVRWRRATGLRR
jgi:hypothetical protein